MGGRSLKAARGAGGLECEVDAAIQTMADFWFQRREELVDGAAEEFLDFVDPVALSDGLDRADVNLIFTEWLLFEHPLDDGATPLERFVDEGAPGADRRGADILAEVAASHFFSRFAIHSKDPRHGTVEVVDVRDGWTGEVLDPYACSVPHWMDGTLSERVARVDGTWLCVGHTRLYDRAPLRESIPVPDDAYLSPPDGASFFLRLVREVVGYGGRYRQTARLVGRPGSAHPRPSG